MNKLSTELRSCVKVEVAVLGSPSLVMCPYALCGRKATMNLNWEPRLTVSITRRTFLCVESVHNFDPGEITGRRKALHVTVTHPCSDHVVLNLASESKCSGSIGTTHSLSLLSWSHFTPIAFHNFGKGRCSNEQHHLSLSLSLLKAHLIKFAGLKLTQPVDSPSADETVNRGPLCGHMQNDHIGYAR